MERKIVFRNNLISVNSPAKDMRAIRRIAKAAFLHNLCPKSMGAMIFVIIFWIISIMNQTYISDYHGAVSLRYKEPILTGQEINNIIKDMILKDDNNIPEVTLWQRAEDIIITNEKRNTSLSIGLITVAGDMTKVYPDSMLYGGYLPRGDDVGCVIDRNTAYKLFNTENVVGLSISLNNKEYIVRGIMKGMGSNTMIVQEEKQVPSKNESIKYSCMELVFSDTENAKYLAEKFINANSLGTPIVYIDGYMYQNISYLLIHIPIWFSALILIFHFARKVNKLKASLVLYVSGWFGIILLSAILIKITNVHINYSSSQLPTRWSDFDFWVNQWKMLKNSFSGTEGSILFYKDMMLKNRMVFVLSGVIIAVLSQAVGIKATRTKKQ